MNYSTCEIIYNVLSGLQTVPNLQFIKPEYRTKFNYAVVKNKRLIQDYFKDIDNVRKTDPLYLEFDGKRIALCEKFADKDTKGDSVVVDGKYAILGHKKEFDEELGRLRNEYASNLYEDDIEFTPYKIKEDWLPISENFIGSYTEILWDMIEFNTK